MIISNKAQACMAYEDWIALAQQTPEAKMQYLGIGLCGRKKLVNHLTGNLPLF